MILSKKMVTNVPTVSLRPFIKLLTTPLEKVVIGSSYNYSLLLVLYSQQKKLQLQIQLLAVKGLIDLSLSMQQFKYMYVDC